LTKFTNTGIITNEFQANSTAVKKRLAWGCKISYYSYSSCEVLSRASPLMKNQIFIN